MDKIKISLEEKVKLSLAELFWFVSDISLGGAQELSEELGLAEQVVQNQLNSLETLGIIKGRGDPKIYSLCSEIPEVHLLWLRRFEQAARETTKQRREELARTPKPRPFECLLRRHGIIFCPQDPAVLGLELLTKLQRPIIILFDSKKAAKEVAWTIRAEWDGLNGVIMEQGDRAALETATALVGAEYCQEGKHCFLPNELVSCQRETSDSLQDLHEILRMLY